LHGLLIKGVKLIELIIVLLNMEKVLISGGSGLLGNRLTQLLLEKGYAVAHLSRSKREGAIETIVWDVEKQNLDPQLIAPFDHIIHLAGAGIVDEAWTEERKKIIIDSRVQSTSLLEKAISANTHRPSSFVSASAIGYYGLSSSNHYLKESDPPGNDFLAETCIKWEESIDKVAQLGIPTAKLRIGIVLSTEGGALKEMARPIKWGLGAPLGKGSQSIPWIHIDDLCAQFIFAMERQLSGAYNAVAPKPVSNKEFTQLVARKLKRPLFLPPVPAAFIRLLMGDRSLLVLEGTPVSSEKIEKEGFKFRFRDLNEALDNLY
jgi:uncharacterized protein (TIGR01777 family)